MSKIDHDWEQLPIAELHQFDALCDRFERAIAEDANARIEPFIAELPQQQQYLLVRELLPLEIEHRHVAGASPDPDEYALRFPQWADDLRTLATQCLEELEQARIEGSETLEENSGSRHTIETKKADLHRQWSDQWQASSTAARSFGLPADGVLGHYQLQSVIGRGGMGLVVRAHDTRLDRDVAIKVLAATVSGDTTTHERFLREARAAAAVRHTNVVTIYAVEIISDIPFLVMELVDGVTLDKYLQQTGKLSPGETVSLAAQIAEGLASAHKQGLIHRDVKPANILLERNTKDVSGVHSLAPWHVRIADFGLARISADQKLTNSGLIAGTPQYMSPEQANGKEIDARSDLFSLGSVMYAMCAGEAAFHAESPLGILRQVADQPARALRDISPQTPDWLVETIEKLMAKSPIDRFQSAGELARLLDHHLHDLHTSSSGVVARSPAADPAQQNLVIADPESAPWSVTQNEPTSKPVKALLSSRRQRFTVALSGLAMIALIGFLIGQIVFRVETPQGTLIVKTDDPDVQISVKSGGTEVALFFPRQKKEIQLKVGEYTIELVKGRNGLKLSTNKFEIQSGNDQRTVTVEFEPRVMADTGPQRVEEQATVTDTATTGEVIKPFAWPAEALWHGRIAAPDLRQAKELYRDDFASLETTWLIARDTGREYAIEQGSYVITAGPGLVGGARLEDKTYANFACQVVGRVQVESTQWFLNYTSVTNDVTVRFHLNGLQGLEVSILNDGPPRVAQTIRHTAINKGDEFNKLLVLAVGNRFEIYVNDVAVCDPIVLDKLTPPGRVSLGAVANENPVRAEFKSLTIWSAESLPTLEERLAGGEPYNSPPASPEPKPDNTSISPGASSAIVPFTPAEARAHQAAWAERLGVAVETENSIGMKLRLIPPGEFWMGSSETELEQEIQIGREKHMQEWVFGYLPFESPKHHVTLTKPFGMGVYEVTRGQFRQFVDATGYITEVEKNGKGGFGFKNRQYAQGPEFLWNTDLGFVPPQTDDCPVVNVAWNDASEFCKWLSEKEGITYRLPWEAEWEFACRGGNEGRFCFGDDVALLKAYGWHGDEHGLGAQNVGQCLGNSFGIYDMHGNAWEWCQDFHGPYPNMAVSDPIGPMLGNTRIFRGGTCASYDELCRSAFRCNGNSAADSSGFRVVRNLEVPDNTPAK